MSYLVHLRQFEGPLGLLLYLIRKEEMDIFDINVGEITQQYLEYIRMMKELDLEVAGEFVAMAATLIHIKSRMLLPQYNEEGEVVEQEDPRKELVQKLLEYQRYQEAAKKLYERPLLNRDVFVRGVREDLRQYLSGEAQVGDIIIDEDGLFSLISTYRKALRKAQKMVHKVRPKVISIAARVMEIKERLIVGTRIVMRDLLGVGGEANRTQLLVTFLSMLELGRMGYISLFQSEVYGDIHIEPKKAIERNVLERVQEFETGDADAIAQGIIDHAIEERIEEHEVPVAAENVEQEFQLSFDGPEIGIERIPDGEVAAGEAIEASGDLGADMATDDEILAAELELSGESLAVPVVHEPVSEEPIETALNEELKDSEV